MSKLPHDPLIKLSEEDAAKVLAALKKAQPLFKKETKGNFFDAIYKANWDLAESLLEAAKITNVVNEVDDNGDTALHLCAVQGAEDMVVKLLACMDPRIAQMRNIDGQTAAHLALVENHEQVFKILMSHFSLETIMIPNKFGLNCLHLAIDNQLVSSLQLIIDKCKAEDSVEILTIAAQFGDQIISPVNWISQKLLKEPGMINIFYQLFELLPEDQQAQNSNFLKECVKGDFFLKLKARDYQEAIKIIPKLKELGVLDAIMDDNGNNVLQFLLEITPINLIEALSEHMSPESLAHKNIWGETAAHIALATKNTAAAEILIKMTPIDILMSEGKDNLNCLHHAMKFNLIKIIEYIVEACEQENKTDLLYNFASNAGAKLPDLIDYASYVQEEFPVMKNIQQKLICWAPNDYTCETISKSLLNILHKLANKIEFFEKLNNKEYSKAEKMLPKMKELGFLDVKDETGNTLLLKCIKEGHAPLIKPIIDNMTDEAISLRDNYGFTAAYCAISKGDTNIAKLIVEKTDLEVLMTPTDSTSNCLILALLKANYEIARQIMKLPGMEINYLSQIDPFIKCSAFSLLLKKQTDKFNPELFQTLTEFTTLIPEEEKLADYMANPRAVHLFQNSMVCDEYLKNYPENLKIALSTSLLMDTGIFASYLYSYHNSEDSIPLSSATNNIQESIEFLGLNNNDSEDSFDLYG